MKCKKCHGVVYVYCPICQKSMYKNKDIIKNTAFNIESMELELIEELKGGYRFCEFCGQKTILDELECHLCGNISVML